MEHKTRTCKHGFNFKDSKNDLVKGLPKIDFQKDKICEACQFGK